MTTDPPSRPALLLKPGQGRRLRGGSPWAFSNEIDMTAEARRLAPGIVVRLDGADGWRHGSFMFNPHSLIAARRLDADPQAAIDEAWIGAKLDAAIALRARLGLGAWHRLVHAEADQLPGLVIDRYGDVAVIAANSAGMDRLTAPILAALRARLDLRAVVARNDSGARRQEGLAEEVVLLHGTDATAAVEEGGLRFDVDLLEGQKTGWFFDQRANRDLVASLAAGARVLDVFCHTGGFGLRCAQAGAAAVTLVDSSAPALERAQAAAEANGLAAVVTVVRDDGFDAMAALLGEGARFDIVVCDPPAFAKSRKDQEAGLRAYGRMARLAASLVAPGGFLFAASCSHHAPAEAFFAQVALGLLKARREGAVVASLGAAPDHPVHPHLPETAYLKAQLLRLF